MISLFLGMQGGVSWWNWLSHVWFVFMVTVNNIRWDWRRILHRQDSCQRLGFLGLFRFGFGGEWTAICLNALAASKVVAARYSQ